MSFALVCAGLMGLLADAAPAASADLSREYQEARAKAGRSSDDQVRLALWCEARGMANERLNHLTLAVLADPTNARARGLMGMVPYEGRFLRPESVAEKAQANPALVEYDKKRLDAPYSADGQWSLGVWADEHGLADQAKAHFTAVIRLDPKRADAWKRLGYRRQGGRWVTDQEVAAEKAEADAQQRANRKWSPTLEDWRRRLAIPSERAKAESDLATLEDPRAVPSILRVFGGVTKEQPRAVQLLGQIDSPASSRALAIMAIAGRTTPVRRAATETLRGRDPIEYAKLLIGLLGEQVRFEVKPVEGLDSPGELLIEGRKANSRRVYTPPTPYHPGDRLGVNESGNTVIFRQTAGGNSGLIKAGDLLSNPQSAMTGSKVLSSPQEINAAIELVQSSSIMRPIVSTTLLSFRFGDNAEIPVESMLAEVKKSKEATERKLRDDVKVLEDYNFGVKQANERVASTLADATGATVAPDRRAWLRWYDERSGYASAASEWTERSADTEQVALDYRPPAVPDGTSRQIIGYDHHDCFAAGTPVQTISGPRAIETLKIGDRVLTQDSKTGALDYQPVLATHRTPALPSFRIKLKGDPIVASHFHRFWVAGRGWVMARELKPGDSLRTLGGVSTIESIEPAGDQTAYNLDVAVHADYFAGKAAALVHDYTQPDSRLVPFDR